MSSIAALEGDALLPLPDRIEAAIRFAREIWREAGRLALELGDEELSERMAIARVMINDAHDRADELAAV